MTPTSLATITLRQPPHAPVVKPDPAPAAVQAERVRLAEVKRARKAQRSKSRSSL